MKSTALIFPGQGSQEVGMGRDIAEASSEAMDLWKKAERLSGIALREIYWDGDSSQMPLTKNLQPALTVVNLSVWMLLSKKITPSFTAGHSLGEYSSLAASGVLPINVILELVSLRARLMSDSDPEGVGSMAAVLKVTIDDLYGLVDSAILKTGEILVVANYNTPLQYVISGTKKAIEYIKENIRSIKGKVIPLAVSGAFHSPLMDEASKELSIAIGKIGKGLWSNAKFPVYSNVTGKGETDAECLRKNLVEQMVSSVQWIDTIRNQWSNGARIFIECGPKSVLSKMINPILEKYILEEEKNLLQVASIGNIKQIHEFLL